MTIHPTSSKEQVRLFINSVKNLSTAVTRSSSSASLSDLHDLHDLATSFKDSGNILVTLVTDQFVKAKVADALNDVTRIVGNLAGRITAFSLPAMAVSSAATDSSLTDSALEMLASIISTVNKGSDACEEGDLYSRLLRAGVNVKNKILENLWRIKGCPKLESTTPTAENATPRGEEGAFSRFGKVSFNSEEFGSDPRYDSSNLEKRLAVELCMKPYFIMEHCIRLFESSQSDQAFVLFKLLPKKIQESVSNTLLDKYWRPKNYSGRIGRVELFGLIEREDILIRNKCTTLASSGQLAQKIEVDVNALIERYHQQFLSIEALELDSDPESSLQQKQLIKNSSVHDIARELLEILDPEIESKDFTDSSKEEIEEIVADYHTRYPSLLHSRVLFLFYPKAFTSDVAPLVANISVMQAAPSAAATESAFERINVDPSALKILSQLVRISREGNEERELLQVFRQLKRETQNEIFENVWRVNRPLSWGCGEKFKFTFGEKSFFGEDDKYPCSAIKKRLAIELCMAPSRILEQCARSKELDHALALFKLLPRKIQESVARKLSYSWRSSNSTGSSGGDALFGLIEREDISILEKLVALSLSKADVAQIEREVNSLIKRYEREFLDIEACEGFPPDEKQMIKKSSVHDIAQGFVKILYPEIESKDFSQSDKEEIQEILADYHARYPSLLHSRVLFLFYPAAFTEEVPSLIDDTFVMDVEPIAATATATAAASAAARVLTRAELTAEGPIDYMPFPPRNPALVRVKKDMQMDRPLGSKHGGKRQNPLAGGIAFGSRAQVLGRVAAAVPSGGTGECPDTTMPQTPVVGLTHSTVSSAPVLSPSYNIKWCISLIAAGQLQQAIANLNLLPERIKESIVNACSRSRYRPATDTGKEVTLSEIFKSYLIPYTEKIKFLQDAVEFAERIEFAVNGVKELAEHQISEIEDQTSEISPEDVQIIKNALLRDLVHDVARRLVGILDYKPFVESSKEGIPEIIQDYYERYPSLLHSKVLVSFYPTALGGDVQPLVNSAEALDSSYVMVDGDLNFDAVPSGVTHPSSSLPPLAKRAILERSEKAGDNHTTKGAVLPGSELSEFSTECLETLRKSTEDMQATIAAFTTPVAASDDEGLSIDDRLRMLRISPRESMIAMSPPILKKCPEELRAIVAEAIMKDFEFIPMITNDTLLLSDLSTHELDRIVWDLDDGIKDLQEFIAVLEENPEARELRDVIEILKVKQKYLSNIYLNLLSHAIALKVHDDPKVFGRMPYRFFERGVVISRINLHTENLQLLQKKDPQSLMIPKLNDTIKELEKFLGELPPYKSQDEMLQDASIADVYSSNLLLADLWLGSRSIQTLKPHARMAVIAHLDDDTIKVLGVIKEAETRLPSMPSGQKKDAFETDIQILKEQLDLVKGNYDQIMRVGILGIKDENRKLFDAIPSSSIDGAVVHEIKKRSLEFLEDIKRSYEERGNACPGTCAAAEECIRDILDSMHRID